MSPFRSGKDSRGAKAKGRAWENTVAAYLQTHGFPRAYRQPKMGAQDQGDIGGVPAAIECKSERSWRPHGWLTEARREAQAAGLPWGAVCVKKLGSTKAEDGVVLLGLSEFCALLSLAQGDTE